LLAGEKLYEELLLGDNVSQSENPLIMKDEEAMVIWEELKLLLEKLRNVSDNSDYNNLCKVSIELVPAFIP
jgi:FlaA1/EpsC-like NDP-sugar epimerase